MITGAPRERLRTGVAIGRPGAVGGAEGQIGTTGTPGCGIGPAAGELGYGGIDVGNDGDADTGTPLIGVLVAGELDTGMAAVPRAP
jgi:hypothetical protein